MSNPPHDPRCDRNACHPDCIWVRSIFHPYPPEEEVEDDDR